MMSSERELARQYSVSDTTVRRVLGMLEQEGYVERYHGRGTVISDPLRQGEFAIVIRPQLLEADASPFYREMASLLSRKISGYNGVQWHPKLHLGKRVGKSKDYPATLDILEPDFIKILRGVFSFHPLWELSGPLKQKNIPFVRLDGVCGKADALINYDREAFYRETSRYLHRSGCKTVGFVCARLSPEDERKPEGNDKYFAEHAIEAGLSIRDEWMLVFDRDANANASPGTLASTVENRSYECFMKFWEQNSHPDAIVIDDDFIACGVLRAILHKQIRIPEQISLVTYANKGVHLPYHLSVTRHEYDMDRMAATAFDAMVKLLNGQKLGEQNIISIPGELIEGETT